MEESEIWELLQNKISELELTPNDEELVQSAFSDVVKVYTKKKQALFDRQYGCCYCCGCRLDGSYYLRQIDPEQSYKVENSCVVCDKCNVSRKDFINERDRKTASLAVEKE